MNAVKSLGYLSCVVYKAGEEEFTPLFLPSVKALQLAGGKSFRAFDGEERLLMSDGGAEIRIKEAQLKQSADFLRLVRYAEAAGDQTKLREAFTALIVFNRVYGEQNGVREYLCLRFDGCSIILGEKGEIRLVLNPKGREGALISRDYAYIDDCFEEGWTYD